MAQNGSPSRPPVQVPTSKSKPGYNLGNLRGLLYGPKKWGKSELAAQFPTGIFLGTEGGLNHLEVFKLEANSWEDFLEICSAAASAPQFSPIIVDTVDNAFQFARRYICAKYRVDHETKIGSGTEGYMLVNDEFRRVMDRLAGLGRGLWFIAHEQEIETKDGIRKTRQSVPALPGKCRDYLTGSADLILYADWLSADTNAPRCLRTRATPGYEAGGRVSAGLPDPIVYNEKAPAPAAEAFQVLQNGINPK